MTDKLPFKKRDQGHVTYFKISGPNNIFGTAKVRVVKCCTHVDYVIFWFKNEKGA